MFILFIFIQCEIFNSIFEFLTNCS